MHSRLLPLSLTLSFSLFAGFVACSSSTTPGTAGGGVDGGGSGGSSGGSSSGGSSGASSSGGSSSGGSSSGGSSSGGSSSGGASSGSGGGSDASVPVDAGSCTSPTACTTAAPVCCGTIPITGGTIPNCTNGPMTTACTPASACATALGFACTGTKTIRLCNTNADCTEPADNKCCTFPGGDAGGSLNFCASQIIASAVPGATCQ